MPDADAGNFRADCTKEIFPGRCNKVFETSDIAHGCSNRISYFKAVTLEYHWSSCVVSYSDRLWSDDIVWPEGDFLCS